MRRLDPRPLSAALGTVQRDLAPATTLARVQEAWPSLAGPAAREASPVSERAGTVTFECRSSVWAGELSLMSRELIGRLNGALGGRGEEGPVKALRFVTGASRSGS
jgi:predicted nucleic acid-binding Zn ribbon protein